MDHNEKNKSKLDIKLMINSGDLVLGGTFHIMYERELLGNIPQRHKLTRTQYISDDCAIILIYYSS